MLTPRSPSTSSSLTIQDPSSSRNRQRSLSMESEASTSSPKRSASQDPLAAQASDMPTTSLTKFASAETDNAIDAYMAEQGDDQGVALPPTPAERTTAQKLQHVEESMKRAMVVGETWYVVSRRWYTRWRKAMTGEEDKEGALQEKDVGAVDNITLCSPDGEVISTLIEHVDCEFVPGEAWKALEEWCVLKYVRAFWATDV